MNPILGLRLVNLNLSENQVGLFFCIASFVYVSGSLFVANLPKSVEKKTWIIFGVLMSFPVQLMMGPSQTFGLPENSVLLIGIGQACLGLFDPFILVFILSEMIEVVEKNFPHLND